MSTQIIASCIGCPQVAILTDGKLCRLFSDDPLGQTGDIYLAKVARLLPTLGVAFLDIGEPKKAVLTLPKNSLLYQGQFIVVMITRPAYAQKGATATTNISLISPYIVYKPFGVGVGISSKIPKVFSHNIKQIITNITQELQIQGGVMGRTLAQTLNDKDILKSHISQLYNTWQAIKIPATKNPQRLYRPLSLLSILSHDIGVQIDEILIDDGVMYDEWREMIGQFFPHLSGKIHLHTPSLFDDYGIYTQLWSALSPQITLPSGVTLVFDECEAMTVIDVNTGTLVNSSQNLIYQANLEACQAITFELKLRQIGGLVVIDFINMKSLKHKQAVYAELQKCLADDHAKIRLLPFNEFGLVQLSRERTSLSLSDIYSTPCSVCQGVGDTKQKASLLAIIAKMTTLIHQNLSTKDDIVLRVSKNIAKTLLDSKDFIKIQTVLQERLSLKIINTYSDDKYDILLNRAK